MTGRAARGVALLAVTALWLVAAWTLWHTSVVPGSLRLPHLDEHAYFSAAELKRSHDFGRIELPFWLGSTAIELVVMGLYAWRGARFARESAAGPIGTGMLLGMLGFGLLWLAELPFTVVELWWERRYGVDHTRYLTAIFGGWVQLGLKFVLLCLALGIVMGAARLLGNRWWVVAAPAFTALTFLAAFLTPFALHLHPLQDRTLLASVQAAERADHVPPTRVGTIDLPGGPNAAATGIGPSRRILITDSIVDGRFTERELRFVVSHEVGHLARRHLLKQVAWYGLFALPEAWLIALLARRRGGMTRPEAVPLALLGFVLFQLLALPFNNAITRHMEAEADWMGLRVTHDPTGATQLFQQFVPTTLASPSDSTLSYLLFDDHPTLMQRIEMAQAWKSYATAGVAQEP